MLDVSEVNRAGKHTLCLAEDLKLFLEEVFLCDLCGEVLTPKSVTLLLHSSFLALNGKKPVFYFYTCYQLQTHNINSFCRKQIEREVNLISLYL